MSDNILKKSEKTDKKFVLIKIVVFILFILLAFEVVIYIFIVPCLAPVKINYSTTKNSSVFSKMLGAMKEKSWIHFDSSEAVSILSSLAFVENVSVEKKFPDKVIIDVKERTPVAMTFVNVDGHTVSVQIDENGVLFPSVGEVVSDGSIPLITGLPFEYVQNGMRLPAKYRSFMEQIAKIKKLPQKYFAVISEIHVIPKDYGNYELILYPVHSKIRVLTDRTLDESALQYMMVMLDVVNSIEPNAVEIDLRYGSISYRTK